MGSSFFFKFLILLLWIASTLSLQSGARVYGDTKFRIHADNHKRNPSPPPPPRKDPILHHFEPSYEPPRPAPPQRRL
ncbi:hypothetical protein O6P43_005130 [Quillaja saponaria]|uniref:Uncharacterized protein n=1 Tax=Quillaja saponaria TaxID=32244 RepID=A0AAD7Q5G7_QUISA|nr:hypothetical protein O6P43_005130 [Quillaja saponaria]